MLIAAHAMGPSLAAAGRPAIVGFVQTADFYSVQRAVDGAAARLSHSTCREVLADFSDAHGRKLADTLVDSGSNASRAFDLLYFFDERSARVCSTGRTLAFTEPGSRVIHICARSFTDAFLKNPLTVELIVIHEFLHALGLGENPPTSAAITARVQARCSS